MPALDAGILLFDQKMAVSSTAMMRIGERMLFLPYIQHTRPGLAHDFGCRRTPKQALEA